MIRPMLLGYDGWYPSQSDACKKMISTFIEPDRHSHKDMVSTVVTPHAGWKFCGSLMVNAVRLLAQYNPHAETVIIFGGHLPAYASPILETFKEAETPLGYLQSDQEIVEFLSHEPVIQTADYVRDNSIEVLFPVVKYFFENSKVVALYLPPTVKNHNLLDKIDAHFGKNSVYIGSTDLTHYGTNYNFIRNTGTLTPDDWVKNVNDRGMIQYLLDMHEEEAIEYALHNSAACSAGAAAAALYMAKKKRVLQGELLGQTTSYDIIKSSSFVGYAAVLY